MNSFADRNAYLNGHDIIHQQLPYNPVCSSDSQQVVSLSNCPNANVYLLAEHCIAFLVYTTVGKVTYMTAINYQDMSLSIRHQLRILLNPAKFIADSFCGQKSYHVSYLYNGIIDPDTSTGLAKLSRI